jgi:hypothetical protein
MSGSVGAAGGDAVRKVDRLSPIDHQILSLLQRHPRPETATADLADTVPKFEFGTAVGAEGLEPPTCWL